MHQSIASRNPGKNTDHLAGSIYDFSTGHRNHESVHQERIQFKKLDAYKTGKPEGAASEWVSERSKLHHEGSLLPLWAPWGPLWKDIPTDQQGLNSWEQKVTWGNPSGFSFSTLRKLENQQWKSAMRRPRVSTILLVIARSLDHRTVASDPVLSPNYVPSSP